MADKPQSVVWRGDVHEGYRDPPVSKTIPAYIPELHASRKCERALKAGHAVENPDPDDIWCDLCTTPDPEAATHRRDEHGRWRKTA